MTPRFGQDLEGTSWSRRALFTSAAGTAAFLLWRAARGATDPAADAILSADNTANPGPVTLVRFDDSGVRLGVSTVPKVARTYAEWKKRLSSEQYAVTRRKGTEPPYSGRYENLHEKGIYRCVCCENVLFRSDTKFDSGTGWPSFWAPIASENVWTRDDASLGIDRTEVLCRECDAHLGHVFDDGPEPTHLRYCMNSLALRFVRTAGA